MAPRHDQQPVPDPLQVIVFGPSSPRTSRAVRARLGCAALEVHDHTELAPALRTDRPVWLLRSGAWTVVPAAFPLPSATGRPLCALGAARGPAFAPAAVEVELWRAALADSGGDFTAGLPAGLPLVSVWLEPSLARAFAEQLMPLAQELGEALVVALRAACARLNARIVHVAALDVCVDPRPRVAQVVTSLQLGGAERVAAELHTALPHTGVASLLVPLYSPTRAELALPTEARPPLRLPPAASRAERLRQLDIVLAREGIDVVHAHLLDGDDLAALAAAGYSVVTTVHNQAQAWPAGLTEPRSGVCLAVGCCLAVEAELRAVAPALPLRTVWNGIAPLRVQTSATRAQARAELGLAADALVLVCIANPRPQKRLDRLPEIVAALRARGRRVVVLLVGAVSRAPATGSVAAMAELWSAADRHGVRDVFVALGAVDPPALPLRAADALVCVSAWEGLSLAWLEALASGTPVVTYAVGGAAEVAALAPAVHLISAESSAEQFAERVLEAAGAAPATQPFTASAMASGYARLLRWAARPLRAGHGLWLVTNNFTTGGAQSSARRLLGELQRRGVRVRAAVVEESQERASPGVLALRAQGIPVCFTTPADRADAECVTAELLSAMAADPPATVVFWNLQAGLRLRLAQALFDVRVVDVSPGEMWFAALQNLFARPRPELTMRSPRDYGARLHGVVVKYAGEAAAAADLLGAPVHVVPNGVDCAPISPRVVVPVLRIGTLARLSSQKRLEELLDAFAFALPDLPPCVLRIAGGPERGTADYAAALQARARALPVEWSGDVAAAPFLAELDLFAMISEPAGCPNASLEAMAHGLPVIATDHGGAGEQVVHGVTGCLVPRADARALAAALVQLGADAALRARLGAAARERIAGHFSVARMADAYAAIFGLA